MPDSSAPGVGAPGIRAPGIGGAGVGMSDISASGVGLPGISPPGISGPGIVEPGIGGPGIGAPGISGPGISGPGISAPGISEAGVSAPGVALPDTSAPGIGTPGSSPPGGSFQPRTADERVEVVSSTVVSGEYHHLVVACSELAATAEPGQFYQLLCPAPPGEAPYLRRPMSLYGADPAARRVEFLYKVTGAGTRGLATLSPGDRMRMLGPLGRGYRLDPAWRHIVAVGRGAGLATLGPLAQAARSAGIGVTAILSARRPDLVVSEALFRAHGATVLTVTDQERNSGPAHVERILRGLIAAGRCDAFFTCGSSRLLRVQQLLARAFALPGQVALEQQMACGLGMCFCCIRDFNVDGEIVHKRVCWDGPVFDLMEALP